MMHCSDMKDTPVFGAGSSRAAGHQKYLVVGLFESAGQSLFLCRFVFGGWLGKTTFANFRVPPPVFSVCVIGSLRSVAVCSISPSGRSAS